MKLTAFPLLALACLAGAQTPPRKQLVEDLRLDATAEDFPALGTVAIGPRGQIAVFIRQDQNLRLYDATGKKVAVFGRKGSGPREFRSVFTMKWKADTVWTYDRSLKRLTFIAQNGDFIRQELIPPNLNLRGLPDQGADPVGAMYVFEPVAIVPDGRVLAWTDVGIGRDEKGQVKTKSALMVADVTGKGRKIVGAQEPAEHVSVYVVDRGDTVRRAGIPFVTYPALSYSTDGTRFGSVTHTLGPRTGSYTVRIIRTTGDTALMRMYPFTGQLIPVAMRDSAIGQVGSRTFSSAINSKLQALARDSTPFIYAPVSEVKLGQGDSNWLVMRATESGQEVLALDATGTAIFSIMLPPRTRLVDASRSTIWTIQTDDDGLESIVRYRIK